MSRQTHQASPDSRLGTQPARDLVNLTKRSLGKHSESLKSIWRKWEAKGTRKGKGKPRQVSEDSQAEGERMEEGTKEEKRKNWEELRL